QARDSAFRWSRADYELIPNGVLIPETADPGHRENRIVFIGRQEPRKGMPVLLRAWPDVHRRPGARLRLVGDDTLCVRLLHTTVSPRRGSSLRSGALRLSRHRAPPRLDRRIGRRVKLLAKLPQSRGARLLLVLPVAAGVGALLYWHGPNWHNVGGAFTAVIW